MKRMISGSIICAALLVLLPVASQAAGAWNVYGGMSVANMGDDIDQFGEELETELEIDTGQPWTAEKKARTGVLFGFGYSTMRTPTVGYQFEVLYVSRGVKFDLDTAGASAETGFKLAYVDVPVLVRLTPSPGGKVQPVFLFGANVGFRTKADLYVEALGDEMSLDAGDLFKSTTFGLIGGAGLKFQVGEKNSLLLQARYNMGLSNILDTSEVTSKPSELMFMAGLEIGLM